MRLRHSSLASIVRAALLAAGTLCPITASAQGWPSFAAGPSHQGESPVASQLPQVILWSTPVDLNPQNFGGDLNAHYGSPVITPKNTIVVPVKVGPDDTFRIEGHSTTNGALIWQLASDYVQPPHDWTLPFQPTLLENLVVVPGAGGTVIVRTNPDNAAGTTTRLAFYGIDNYNDDPGAYNNSIQINTPITADASGNLYFGFLASGAPGNIVSGLACVNLDGTGTWISAAAAANDETMQKVAYNCAPAISADGKKVYVGINNVNGFANGGTGYLVAVQTVTLAPVAAVLLMDVANPQNPALFFDDSSATPTVGPDGDVYYGVLENPFPSNHDRGWLLHFDSELKTAKTAGAFGWDITASVVPAGAVPSYRGKSTYLILTKYNDYADVGGDGVNRLAVQDPNATMVDPVTGAKVMKTVITIIGPTPDQTLRDQGHPLAVYEWCINTAAVDPKNKCAVVNSEDGNVYRWDFTTNSLTARIILNNATGEPYTPTIIGPDGKVYAINDATLYALGVNP
jgi:hypothetical protein